MEERERKFVTVTFAFRNEREAEEFGKVLVKNHPAAICYTLKARPWKTDCKDYGPPQAKKAKN